jgi:hypothetical protein
VRAEYGIYGRYWNILGSAANPTAHVLYASDQSSAQLVTLFVIAQYRLSRNAFSNVKAANAGKKEIPHYIRLIEVGYRKQDANASHQS